MNVSKSHLTVLFPEILLLNFIFLLWDQMNSKRRSNKTIELIPGRNHLFQNVIKRCDSFLRHFLFCILPFFYRASSVCISWEVALEKNTPNQQIKRIGKLATSPAPRSSLTSHFQSVYKFCDCSGALTPFSQEQLFHSSGRSSSLSIQHFGKGHQVSLLPPHSSFLFSMSLSPGSYLGLLPLCLAHNQQKGRYITISHQEYEIFLISHMVWLYL